MTNLDFYRANLARACRHGTNLTEPDLSKVDLTGAEGLDLNQLDAANGDEATQFV